MKGKKKGISAIVGSLIFLQILLVSVLLVIYVTNHQTTATERSIASLEKSTHGVIYEKYENGQTYLIVTQPTNITHVVYPNGTVKNTSILVTSQINANEILNGQPWAVITTSQGEWFNVTPITLPQINDPPQPSYVCGQPVVPVNPGPNPNWTILKGIEGVSENCNKTVVIHSNNTVTIGFGTHNQGENITVDNPYWDWAVHQLELNNYSFPFRYPPVFPFSSSYFDPWGNYSDYYRLVTSPLGEYNNPALLSNVYDFAPYNWPNYFSPGFNVTEQEQTIYLNVTCSYEVPVQQGNQTVWVPENGQASTKIGEELIINNMPVGIKFSYNYLTAPITVFAAYNVSGTIYYVSYYFNIVEIYNLEALIPKQVDIVQIYPASISNYFPQLDSVQWFTTPSSALSYVAPYINVQTTQNYFDIWTTPATVVGVNGTEWVHNIVPVGTTNNVSYNLLYSTVYLQVPAPPSPKITVPDSPPKNASITIYYPNNKNVSVYPIWTLFPATNYTNFPAYIGHDNYLPAYLYTEGMPTNIQYLWETFPFPGPFNFNKTNLTLANLYSYNYEGWGDIGNWSTPLTNFSLYVADNGSIFATVQGISPPEIYPSNIIFDGEPNGYWQLAGYYPIFVFALDETYIGQIWTPGGY